MSRLLRMRHAYRVDRHICQSKGWEILSFRDWLELPF